MLKLLTDMPPERFETLYKSLDPNVARAFDGAIAQVLNCRLASVGRQPEAMRIKALRIFVVREKDEDVAGDLLRAYLLGPRKAIVTGFLDATGCNHEDGEVEEDDEPDPKKVTSAIEQLNTEHDPADVALYLAIAATQWPDCEPLVAAVPGGVPGASGTAEPVDSAG